MFSRAKFASDETPFVSAVLSGRAEIEDIDDYIDYWHDAPLNSQAAQVELHEFLGLTWDEYRLWVERPESIRFVFAARRAKVSTERIVAEAAHVGAAARTSDSDSARSVLQWLLKTGRVSQADLQ